MTKELIRGAVEDVKRIRARLDGYVPMSESTRTYWQGQLKWQLKRIERLQRDQGNN
jgi:hypothetical protein